MDISPATILKINPYDIDLSALPVPDGQIYEHKCKICKSDWRRLVDYMLYANISRIQIVEYFRSHGILFPYKDKNTALNETNLSLHSQKHLDKDNKKLQNALVKAEDDIMKSEQGKQVEAQLAKKDIPTLTEEIARKSFVPYYLGKPVPLNLGLQAARIAADKQQEEVKEKFLKDFFTSAKNIPIKNPKLKRKVKVNVGGVEVEQEIAGEA